MILTLSQWLALAPMLALAAGIVGLMLLIAITRNHAATAQLTTLGFLIATAATELSSGAVGVTPLLLCEQQPQRDRGAHGEAVLGPQRRDEALHGAAQQRLWEWSIGKCEQWLP